MDPRKLPAASPAPAVPGEPRHHDSASNIKELIESILVAFILAFIFRAFVVEAFVIPTGSMATTLLGAHMRFVCQDCGYRFDTNYPTDNDTSIPPFARHVDDIHCPNCGYMVQKLANAPRSGDATPDTPAVFYGDRILVLKYLYLFQDPKRWDVVVFKSPMDPKYEMNYIKRLIGKPGETIMILDGDIYVQERGSTTFNIQTKPRAVQDAMWRLVYDNDFAPQGLPRTNAPAWQQPWTPAGGSGWSTGSVGNNRVFTFDNATGDGMLAFSPDPNSLSQAMTDYLVYDIPATRRNAPYSSQSMSSGHEEPVSDLDLRLTYRRTSGDGPLWLRLKKRDVQFTAEIGPDSVKLLRKIGDEKESQIGSTVPLPVKPNATMRIEFVNVDYRVALRIDGRELVATTPDDYSPQIDKLLAEYDADVQAPPPGVAVGAAQQACTISHLSLWRDVYYTNHYDTSSPLWASPRQFPEQLMRLGDDEFFVLGDNSVMSSDARGWASPIRLPDEDLDVEPGRVPARFMLGKAFFVYWPAGYRPFASGPAFTPNFGDMRFIH